MSSFRFVLLYTNLYKERERLFRRFSLSAATCTTCACLRLLCIYLFQNFVCLLQKKKRGAHFDSVLIFSSWHHSFNVSLCFRSEEFKRLTHVICLDMQVLDARDPQGTRCYHLERHLKEHKHKHMILLLNKVSNYIILSENPFSHNL